MKSNKDFFRGSHTSKKQPPQIPNIQYLLYAFKIPEKRQQWKKGP